jgi:hypothetical protein
MVTYMMKKLGFVDTRANLVWGAAASARAAVRSEEFDTAV